MRKTFFVAVAIAMLGIVVGCATQKSAKTEPTTVEPVENMPVSRRAPQEVVGGTRDEKATAVASPSSNAAIQDGLKDMAKIVSYKPGITTEAEFWEDGWNFEDPFQGKLGILRFVKSAKHKQYVMGFYMRRMLPTAREHAIQGLKFAHSYENGRVDPPFNQSASPEEVFDVHLDNGVLTKVVILQ